jgi:hypothetical protein
LYLFFNYFICNLSLFTSSTALLFVPFWFALVSFSTSTGLILLCFHWDLNFSFLQYWFTNLTGLSFISYLFLDHYWRQDSICFSHSIDDSYFVCMLPCFFITTHTFAFSGSTSSLCLYRGLLISFIFFYQIHHLIILLVFPSRRAFPFFVFDCFILCFSSIVLFRFLPVPIFNLFQFPLLLQFSSAYNIVAFSTYKNSFILW